MGENILLLKSKKFSIRIVNLYKYLIKEKKEFTLSKQVFKSGTSIGANICEANFAQSKKDFVSKLGIALKETSETIYWLELLYETDYINCKEYEAMNEDCIELIKILQASIKTSKINNA